MSDPVLQLHDVTMQFGGVVAVNGLSLEVHKGEIVAIIGPNGAGKTTAFNVITGVYAPSNGAVSFHGETIISNYPKGKLLKSYAGGHLGEYDQVVRKAPDRITKLGIARTFQNIRLFKDLTVFENVLIAKHMNMKANLFSATAMLNHKEEKEMRRQAMELLDILELGDVKDEISSSLPYGKQRRLEIARALATGPALLLLDEPAAGMNPSETQDLLQLILRIRKDYELTVFLIEHDMKFVMEICERIKVLDYGTTIAEGTPHEIQNNPRVIEAYLGEVQCA